MTDPVPMEARDLSKHVELCWHRYETIRSDLRKTRTLIWVVVIVSALSGHDEALSIVLRLVALIN